MGTLHPDWHLRNLQVRSLGLSLLISFAILVVKGLAYWLTAATAALADAAESVVHLLTVAFAFLSLHLSWRPPNERFPYGYERIAFFSAGFEGAVIGLTAVFVFLQAIERFAHPVLPDRLPLGSLLLATAGIVNGLLGLWLLRLGNRSRSLILAANGRHLLADSLTSLGVVAGLLLVLWTKWALLDPLVALVVSLTIFYSAGQILGRSIRGLLDYADPKLAKQLRQLLDQFTAELNVNYHGLRFRDHGSTIYIDIHLLFPGSVSLKEAHWLATKLEQKLATAFDRPVVVNTHLESIEDHSTVHPSPHYMG